MSVKSHFEHLLRLIAKTHKPIAGSTVDLFASVMEKAPVALRPFTVGGHSVIPGELTNVARKVRHGPILSYWDSGFSNTAARYLPGGVFFFLPRGVFGQTKMVWASTIVHEAIHCAADLRGQHKPYRLSSFIDESAAHIAQAMFLIHYKQPMSDLKKGDDDVVMAAWPIAQSIIDGKRTSVAGSELKAALTNQGYTDDPSLLRGIVR